WAGRPRPSGPWGCVPGGGGDRRRHRAAAQAQHLPGVPGGGRAAAGRQPWPGRAWPARSRPARGGLDRQVVPAAGAAVSARYGVGDGKLAPTLGLALGWRSWGTVAVGVVA